MVLNYVLGLGTPLHWEPVNFKPLKIFLSPEHGKSSDIGNMVQGLDSVPLWFCPLNDSVMCPPPYDVFRQGTTEANEIQHCMGL